MYRDKLMHLAFGATTAVATLALLWIAKLFGPLAACMAAAIAVGVGYEVVQKIRGDGVADPHDAVATAAGGASVVIPLAIVLLLLGGCSYRQTEDVLLSERTKEACEAEGGCVLITRKALIQKLEQAFSAGKKDVSLL